MKLQGAAPVDPAAHPRARRVLLALCITVTVSYGVLYYAFTVLAPGIAQDTGWSNTAVTAAFSAGSLVGALLGIPVGRALQRRGPRSVMTVGSLSGSAAVVIVAVAPNLPVFVLAWLVVGASSACTSYPPAFAALTRWCGARQVRAITTLTLATGFASIVFAPLAALLVERVGWRTTYVVLAVLLLVVNVPIHAMALRLPWTTWGGPDRADQLPGITVRTIIAGRTFVLVTASGTLTFLVMYASLVNLVPLLLERGLSVEAAAWALGLGGAGQVAGRLLYPVLVRRLEPGPRAAAVDATLSATLVGLAVMPAHAAALMGLTLLSGAARGLCTLVSATAVSDRWGASRYAALNGVYNAPLGIAAALGPAFGAAAAAWTGTQARSFLVLGGLGMTAALVAVAARDRDQARPAEWR